MAQRWLASGFPILRPRPLVHSLLPVEDALTFREFQLDSFLFLSICLSFALRMLGNERKSENSLFFPSSLHVFSFSVLSLSARFSSRFCKHNTRQFHTWSESRSLIQKPTYSASANEIARLSRNEKNETQHKVDGE